MPESASLHRRTVLKLSTLVGAGLALPSMAYAAPAVRESVPLVIRHATVLSMDPNLAELPDADVLINNGKIIAVGRDLAAEGAQVIEATGMILIPGLVDAHWHLWNSFLRSSSPAPQGQPFFKSQLAVSKHFTPELSALGVRMGLAEAINSGITTVNNWAHNLRTPAFAQAELQAMLDSGLRGRFWYGYAQDLAATAPVDYADILRVQAQLKGSSRFDLGMAIRGPERTEEAIWEPEFAFAKAHGLPISTHIAVTPQMQQKKGVQQLAKKGVLNPSVQLVHATHADAEDLRSIAHSGASVCLTPLTEMRVGYGLAPVAALHEAKIPVTLGIDTLVLSGNANLFMVMQTLLNLATGSSGNEQLLSARDVLYWATQGGANAMGLGAQIGSVSPGKRADLTLIDPRGLGMLPVLDPYASVVQSATPSAVNTVIADGWILKAGGRVTGIDTPALGREVVQGLATLQRA